MKRLHVSVAVSDIENSIEFYSTLFGAAPAVRKPDYAKWMLEDPHVNFSISSRGRSKGVDHLGIQVEDDAELALVADAWPKPARQSPSRRQPPAVMRARTRPGCMILTALLGRPSTP
jgi:catechol 2,3-dioxygenase-like lactoylglutathione lyase family enzyme